MLRPGNAGSNTAADHKQVLHETLTQLPWNPSWRVSRKVLVRTDSGGGTHEFIEYCHRRGVQYSIGFTLTDETVEAMDTYLRPADWTPAYDADGQVRDGAWVVEVTGIAELSGWPPGDAPGHQERAPARRWEPKTLRLRLFSIPARLARHARRVHLRLSAHNPWTTLAVTAFTRLAAP